MLSRVLHPIDHMLHSFLKDKIGARQSLTVMTTGFQIHVEDIGRLHSALESLQESPLSVGKAESLMPALRDDRALPDEHRAYERIDANSAPATRGELKATMHEGDVFHDISILMLSDFRHSALQIFSQSRSFLHARSSSGFRLHCCSIHR